MNNTFYATRLEHSDWKYLAPLNSHKPQNYYPMPPTTVGAKLNHNNCEPDRIRSLLIHKLWGNSNHA